MKTVELKKEEIFDVALAENRMDYIQTKNNKISETIEYKIQQGIQKLLQIILRNVSINKTAEIGLLLYRDNFKIQYIYDTVKKYSCDIEFSFARKYDVYDFSGTQKGEVKKLNINEGDIKCVDFNGFKVDFLRGEGTFEDFDCILLYGYIGKEIRNGGEFISTLKFIYDDLNKMWNEMEEGWNEYRELNGNKQKHFKAIYEQEIRNSNYFKEGNYIVIRNLKKDFLEASVYAIGKVQKTTFYCRSHSIEIKSLHCLSDEKQQYALSVESYRREDKRHTIDTYIRIWADERAKGNKIEVISTEAWLKLNKEMEKEYDLIRNDKLDEKSKMYHDIKYRKED
jgi:hypothetical protein